MMFFGGAEILYWQAQSAFPSLACTENKLCKPHFAWDVGYRAEIGAELEYQECGVHLIFTHLHTKAHGAKSDVILLSDIQQLQNLSCSIYERWRLHLGFVDLVGQCPLYADESVSFVAFGGIRYVMIRQKYKAENETSILFGDSLILATWKNKYWGFGPLLGCLGFWKGNFPIGFYFRMSASTINGEIYVHQHDDKQRRLRTECDRVQPMGTMHFGGFYEKRCKRGEIGVFLGYEWTWIPSQNALISYLNEKSSTKLMRFPGDLTLQGASFRFTFCY